MSLIAVDFGGTWLRASIVEEDGRCGPVMRRATQSDRSPDAIVADLADLIKEAQSSAGHDAKRLEGVSVAIATVIDEEGCLEPCDNLPTLTGYPLQRDLQAKLPLPLALYNDATSFTMGEWWRGAGREAANFCGVALGTGIGMGIVINRRIYQGSHGAAGEIWLSPLEGGTVEDVVCGGGIQRAYERAAGRLLKGAEIAALAEQGDERAQAVFTRFGEQLGVAVSYLINIVDPECVCFGGSVSASFSLFREALLRTVHSGTMMGTRVRLEPSLLGDQAALLGAAKLFWDRDS